MQTLLQDVGQRPLPTSGLLSKEECEMFADRLGSLGELLAAQPVRDTFDANLQIKLAALHPPTTESSTVTEASDATGSDFEDGHVALSAKSQPSGVAVEPRHKRRRTRHVIQAEEKLQKEIRERLQLENNKNSNQTSAELVDCYKKDTKLTFVSDLLSDKQSTVPVKATSSALQSTLAAQQKISSKAEETKLIAEFGLKDELRTVEADFDALMNRPELLTFLALDNKNDIIGSATRSKNDQEQRTVSKLHQLASYLRESTESCLDQLAPGAGPLLVEVQLTNGMSLFLQTEPQQPRKTFLMSVLRSAAEVKLLEAEQSDSYKIDYPLTDMVRDKKYNEIATLNEPIKYTPQPDSAQQKTSFLDLGSDVESAQINSSGGGRGRPKLGSLDVTSQTAIQTKATEEAREAAKKVAQAAAVDRVSDIIKNTKRLSEVNEDLRLQKITELEAKQADNQPVFKTDSLTKQKVATSHISVRNSRTNSRTSVVNSGSLTALFRGRPK